MHDTRGWFSMFWDIIFDSSNIFWIEASSISSNNINVFIGKFKIKIGVPIFWIKAMVQCYQKTGSINVCSMCECVCVCVKFLKKVYLSSLWVLVHTWKVSSTLQLTKKYVKIYTHSCTPDEPKRYKNIEIYHNCSPSSRIIWSRSFGTFMCLNICCSIDEITRHFLLRILFEPLDLKSN